MNSQVMLEALEAQLSIKKSEVDKYRLEVYAPQVQELKKNVIDRLNSTLCPDRYLIKGVDIHSESMSISTKENDRYGSTIRFETRGWNDENRSYRFVWYSGEATTGDGGGDRDYGILVGRISEKFDYMIALIKDDILPKYRKIEKEHSIISDSMAELERSINQLKQSIDSEAKKEYYKPGFYLKLKEFKTLDWVNREDGSQERKLVSQPGSVKLISGRSKYDYDFVTEFKVLGKKGYKYTLETRVFHRPEMLNEIQVTEMRMQEFVDSVYHWETVEADKKTKRAEERLEEIIASEKSTTLPTL